SFYPTKNLGALGDGGAVCTDDSVLAARLRRVRNVRQRAQGGHVELGYTERPDALHAALLHLKLPHPHRPNPARPPRAQLSRARAELYRERLGPALRLLDETPESPCIYPLFPVRIAEREAVAARLKAAGVDTAVHYAPAVHGHRLWVGLPLRHGELPRAEAWA